MRGQGAMIGEEFVNHEDYLKWWAIAHYAFDVDKIELSLAYTSENGWHYLIEDSIQEVEAVVWIGEDDKGEILKAQEDYHLPPGKGPEDYLRWWLNEFHGYDVDVKLRLIDVLQRPDERLYEIDDELSISVVTYIDEDGETVHQAFWGS